MDMPVDVPIMTVIEAKQTNGVQQLAGNNWLLDYRQDAHPVLLVRHEQPPAPEPQPEPEPVERVRATVYFPTNSAALAEKDAAKLRGLAQTGRYAVLGYADPRGTKAYNQRLSEKRAKAVASLLREAGAEPAHVVGFGEKHLVSKGKRTRFALDRRVEIKPIQGE